MSSVSGVRRDERPLKVAQRSGAGLRCQLVTEFTRVASLQPVWDAAVLRLGGPIYMTFDWVKTWWEFYGRDNRVRLFLFWHNDELVALLPLYLEEFGFGPLKTTVARLIGANIPPKTFNPPVDSAFARDVLSVVAEYIFCEDRCDLICLGPVSAMWPCSSILQELNNPGGVNDFTGRVSYLPRDVQIWFPLPATFSEYLNTLSRTERKNRLKRLRHLENNYDFTTDVVADRELVEREFESFVLQHARQWEAVNKPGHFAAWPMGEGYNRALVKAQAKHGRVRFFRMLVDGKVAANRYTFLLGSTLYSELPAREVGEPWDKLGIGGISLLKFNEAAIKCGVRSVDSGLGEYEHKSSLGGVQIQVGTWYLFARGFRGLKARFFRVIAEAIVILCRKVWYRRILPRMPKRFKRTQQIWWLRFDL